MQRPYNYPLTVILITISFCLIGQSGFAQKKPRARDLGIPFEGSPGQFNAITDVKGLEVGHTTLSR